MPEGLPCPQCGHITWDRGWCKTCEFHNNCLLCGMLLFFPAFMIFGHLIWSLPEDVWKHLPTTIANYSSTQDCVRMGGPTKLQALLLKTARFKLYFSREHGLYTTDGVYVHTRYRIGRDPSYVILAPNGTLYVGNRLISELSAPTRGPFTELCLEHAGGLQLHWR